MTLVEPAWERWSRARARTRRGPGSRRAGQLLDEARALLSGYYRLEDPTRFDPESCEQRVEVELSDGTLLRGFVDRIDVAADRRAAGGRLQDRQGAVGHARTRRGQGDVPDEVLRGGAAAVPRRAARPAAVAVPRRRPGAGLHARPRRAGAVREDVDGDVAGHPIRGRHRRFPAATRRGCATGARTTSTARPSAALRRPTPGGRTPSRQRNPRHDRLLLPAAAAPTATPSSSSRTMCTASNWDADDPARFTAAGSDDEGDRGAGAPGSGQRVGRLLLDILGAIPVAPVRVRAWVHASRRANLLVSRRDVRRTPGRHPARRRPRQAWLLAASDTARRRHRPPSPDRRGRGDADAHGWQGAPGYLESISWRTQAAAPTARPSVAWLSPLVPLVDDEPDTDLQRLAMVVDSANGVGAALDPASSSS